MMKISVMTADFWATNQTWDLPNMNQESFFYLLLKQKTLHKVSVGGQDARCSIYG
jgi:hypothetical protein